MALEGWNALGPLHCPTAPRPLRSLLSLRHSFCLTLFALLVYAPCRRQYPVPSAVQGPSLLDQLPMETVLDSRLWMTYIEHLVSLGDGRDLAYKTIENYVRGALNSLRSGSPALSPSLPSSSAWTWVPAPPSQLAQERLRSLRGCRAPGRLDAFAAWLPRGKGGSSPAPLLFSASQSCASDSQMQPEEVAARETTPSAIPLPEQLSRKKSRWGWGVGVGWVGGG